MSFDLGVGIGQRCMLYGRSEYRSRFPFGAPEERAGRDLIGSLVPGDLARNTAQLGSLRDFLVDCRVGHYAGTSQPHVLSQALQRAVIAGDVIAVVERPRASSAPRPSDEEPRAYSFTITPSQLYRRVARVVASTGLSVPRRRKLAAEDGIAIWFADPGDVLPDGTIARPLGSAQPFQYQPSAPIVSEALQLAGSDGTPGNNQAQNRQFKAVVKIMGLTPRQARLLHEEITGEGLGYHDILERAHDMFGGR